MSSKKIILAILIALSAIAAIYLVLPRNDQTNSGPNTGTSDNQTPNQSDSSKPPANTNQTYTAEEVAAHDQADDCWSIINGAIYDLTDFISQHPGGDEILRACGQDASSLFNNRETDNGQEVGSGTPHSSDARRQLEALKIGRLAD